jgi:hypothetical protein
MDEKIGSEYKGYLYGQWLLAIIYCRAQKLERGGDEGGGILLCSLELFHVEAAQGAGAPLYKPGLDAIFVKYVCAGRTSG